MGLTLVEPTSPPEVPDEPVSITEAKSHMRVTTATDDTTIGQYLVAARRHAENHIRGAIVQHPWDFTIDYGWPLVCDGNVVHRRIELPLHPVQSVSSVSYVDAEGQTQTLDDSLYTVHLDGPVAFIEKAYGANWPEVRSVPRAITVRFVAGYNEGKVPRDICTAILLHTEILYDRNPNEKELLESARDALLDPYRVLRVA